jgi:hypothetical protein
MIRLALGMLAGLTVLLSGSTGLAATKGAMSGWAAVVVAGDFHGSGGGDTEAFDNARRDISQALVEKMGFAPENVQQFSVRPELYTPRPGRSTLFEVQNGLKTMAGRATAGCLFYFTSHGTKYGAFLGHPQNENSSVIYPVVMAQLVNSACPGRPTIVVISTCYSGVNLPVLEESSRLVLTSARSDRVSFGCGEGNVYPYFDECFLEAASSASRWAVLPAAVLACVSRKELETGAAPPSEPQVWIGSGIRPLLPLYAFPKGG